jgi:hypothetical protein
VQLSGVKILLAAVSRGFLGTSWVTTWILKAFRAQTSHVQLILFGWWFDCLVGVVIVSDIASSSSWAGLVSDVNCISKVFRILIFLFYCKCLYRWGTLSWASSWTNSISKLDDIIICRRYFLYFLGFFLLRVSSDRSSNKHFSLRLSLQLLNKSCFTVKLSWTFIL